MRFLFRKAPLWTAHLCMLIILFEVVLGTILLGVLQFYESLLGVISPFSHP